MSKKTSKAKDSIVDVPQVYSKTEKIVDEHKNTILIAAGILVVLFIGYFGVTRFYLDPRSQEGMDLIWKAEYWFEIDSLDKALYGDESYYGFEYIASEYSSTKAGSLAAYYAGVINLQQGEFDRAIAYLKAADRDDNVAGAMAKGLIGDAYVELGNYKEALSYFDKAVNHSDNSLTAPMYLKKAALIHEDLGDFPKALKNYQAIKEKYPTSAEANGVESYIARVGG